jgi:putative tricarboxylic transport membrane protein
VRHRDLTFGGAALAISAIYYWMATSVPVSQLSDAIGPQGLPKIYAVILAALSLMLISRSIRAPGLAERESSKTASGPRGSRISDSKSRWLRAAGMLLIGMLYVVAAPWLGYLLSISGLILATTYYQGGTVGRTAALVALCGGVFFWLLFVVFMGIAQPPGFFLPVR